MVELKITKCFLHVSLFEFDLLKHFKHFIFISDLRVGNALLDCNGPQSFSADRKRYPVQTRFAFQEKLLRCGHSVNSTFLSLSVLANLLKWIALLLITTKIRITLKLSVVSQDSQVAAVRLRRSGWHLSSVRWPFVLEGRPRRRHRQLHQDYWPFGTFLCH